MTQSTTTLPPGGQRRQHVRVSLSADQARRAQLAVVSPVPRVPSPPWRMSRPLISVSAAPGCGPDRTSRPNQWPAAGLQFTSTRYLSEGAEVRLTVWPAQSDGDRRGADATVTITGRLVRVRGLMARNAAGELTLRYRYGVQFAPDSAAAATRALSALET